jgi:isoquinoline 1-oxidoreductase beta subunit
MAAPLETACAVARLRDGLCEVWLATQAPEAARRAIADALDIALDHVVLTRWARGQLRRAAGMPAWGGSGADRQGLWQAGDADLHPLAGTVRAIHRAPMAAQVEARVDQNGGIAAWRLRVAMPSSARGSRARG